VLIPLAELLAARDWHPHITPEGAVGDVARFVDLDHGLPEDLAALDARVCLIIGVTRRPATTPLLDAAEHLDLVLTSQEASHPALVHVPDVDAVVAELTTALDSSPRAALVLASILRQSAQLAMGAAIAAEAAAYSTLLAGPEFAAWLSGRGARRAVPASDAPRVAVAICQDVLSIRLTRKLRLNAIDAAMRAALVEALEIAIADNSLRVELSGDGPCFSNGGDLREFGTTPDPATAWAVRVSQHPGWQLAQVADRAVVRMHGACVGAGVELAAFAGRVDADPETTFLLPELAMGLIPGAGGCVSIPRRIGRWRTLWLVAGGHMLTAPQALAWGLIDDITSRA